MNRKLTCVLTSLFALAQLTASAHDIWTQTNIPVVAPGEIVHVDLCLGNHGNHHRDFKLAGLVSLDWVTAEHQSPDGSRVDLRDKMTSTAMAEKEGYWTQPLLVEAPGVHCIAVQLDRIMQHGKSVRGVRTAKSYFLASHSIDDAKIVGHDHKKPLGMPFEVVLQTCPFTETAVGQPLTVQVLHQGKPKKDVVVSFIPQGAELQGEFDPDFQFRTDSGGLATFVPKAGNRYLIVAHHTADDEKSDEYEFTSYAATVTLHVPVRRPLATQ
ncbi:DUF4198 domain-containing protein [Rosistilla oblonga]|uniref:DUF4198 domain-containing protein n=1 Tax=Rosistilla oblonga TaxID=2527990 RepID=UPI003A97FF50